MPEDCPRDGGGQFTEIVSDQDILKIFDATDEPFLTTAEVTDELPVSQDAVYRRLEGMREQGVLEKTKNRRASGRVVGHGRSGARC